MAIKLFGKNISPIKALCSPLFAGLLLAGAGCQSPEIYNAELAKLTTGTGSGKTNSLGSDNLRIGESLTIYYSDTPQTMLPTQERVKDDGTIRLIHNQVFVAVGKTRSALEQEIHDRYVTNYYHNMTVSIKQEARFYFVEGQIKNPSKQEYVGPTTVIKAIASAGGFTEFAKTSSVKLIREGGRIETIHFKKALNDPRLDLPVYPGDTVSVKRKTF